MTRIAPLALAFLLAYSLLVSSASSAPQAVPIVPLLTPTATPPIEGANVSCATQGSVTVCGSVSQATVQPNQSLVVYGRFLNNGVPQQGASMSLTYYSTQPVCINTTNAEGMASCYLNAGSALGERVATLTFKYQTISYPVEVRFTVSSDTVTTTPTEEPTVGLSPTPDFIGEAVLCTETDPVLHYRMCASLSEATPPQNTMLDIYGRLWMDDVPEPGRLMEVRWNSIVVCSATTDSDGFATCSFNIGNATGEQTAPVGFTLQGGAAVGASIRFTPVDPNAPTEAPTLTPSVASSPTLASTATLPAGGAALHLPVVLAPYGPTATSTSTSTPTPSLTPSVTPTASVTRTPTETGTPTNTPEPTFTRVPTSTRTPTRTPTPRAGNCDPSYPTVCIPPPPPDLDCTDIPYRRFTVRPPDPHDFDSDGDGIGCEN
jgi:hypothetical protein